MQFLEQLDSCTWRLKITLKPGAGKDGVYGSHAGRLKVSVKAPPVDGKANKALCIFLSSTLGIRKNQICIQRGFQSKNKEIIVKDVPEAVFNVLQLEH